MSTLANIPDFDIEDLKERVGPGMQDDTTSLDDASCTVQYMVDWDKTYGAEVFILGCHYVERNDGDVYKLRRRIPMRHPRKPHLYAVRVMTDPTRWYGVDEYSVEPEWKVQSRTSKFKFSMLKVEFRPLNFKALPDEEVTLESDRYIRRSVKNATDVLTSQAGQYKWAEGPLAGKPLMMDIAVKESKLEIQLDWLHVPEEFIFDEDGRPIKLEAAAGCVNKEEFLGYPAETLLLEDFAFEYANQPLATDDWQAYPTRHVKLSILFFDPPQGGGVGAQGRGHNILPYRHENLDGNKIPYYLATLDGINSGARRFYEYDFNKLFTHWSEA